MKKEIRLLGFDDAPFDRNEEEALVIGTFMRGSRLVDGILSTTIKVDGEDATVKLIELINQSKFKSQTQAVLLDGIAFGGFNVININSIYKHTNIPVIVVIRNYPDFEEIKKTLKKINMAKKYTLMEKAGQPIKINDIYCQLAGLEKEKAQEILNIATTHGHLPEPIRVSHLIGQGLIFGESKGNA